MWLHFNWHHISQLTARLPGSPLEQFLWHLQTTTPRVPLMVGPISMPLVNGISLIPFSIGVFVFVLLVSQEETVKLLLQTAR